MHPGGTYHLECLNDYLFTITCVLNASTDLQAHGATSWLEFHQLSEHYRCELKEEGHWRVCELDLSGQTEGSFTDVDIFTISLNSSYHGNNSSAILNPKYRPKANIRPLPPSNLSLLWETDRAVFNWLSGYQRNSLFVRNLQYQLSIHGNNQILDLHSTNRCVVVDVSSFAPETTYMVRVRSEPNQVYYKGVWSQWGPAIRWTTDGSKIREKVTRDSSISSFWFACFCLLPVLGLLLSYIPYHRWKKQVLSSSPTPYIRDFKRCALLSEIESELLKGEESLKIDSMFEDTDSAPSLSPPENKRSNVYEQFAPAFIPSSPTSTSSNVLLSPAECHLSMTSSWLNNSSAVEFGSVSCSDDYCFIAHTHPEQASN
ncbi:interleukin-21 receptor [Hoplias malabaricus]|uniref:interleukin-21 receptor n=1 Tax=Hoplias malabaricus TaxID=27720 RepID=UPI0034627707